MIELEMTDISTVKKNQPKPKTTGTQNPKNKKKTKEGSLGNLHQASQIKRHKYS